MVKKRKVRSRSAKPKKRSKKAVKRPSARRSGTSKPAAKKAKIAAKKSRESALEKVGEVTHYFPHVRAAAVLILKDGLKVGDDIYIKGHTTDFKEKISSIQLDHAPIQESRKGQEIGLLVKSRVRIGDSVYRI